MKDGNIELEYESTEDYFNKLPNESCLLEFLEIFSRKLIETQTAGDERKLVYRGHSDTTYKILPSVFRDKLIESEHFLIRDLIHAKPHEFSKLDTVIEKIMKMQHFGLPTRLLDVTFNPLVALYFACSENFDKDGEILVFYDYILSPDDSKVQAMAQFAEYYGNTQLQLAEHLKKENLKISDGDVPFVIVEGIHNNDRIIRQQGAFVLFGLRNTANYNENVYSKDIFSLDYKLEDKITVSKEIKQQLLYELNAFGINEAFLFPELEHHTNYIKKKYIKEE